ncbi:MAG: HDOD domain-containing protein [Rhodocyclaceae bacterium]|nr:HDOD domain-containing protein [Rhodocyclaceae bacterium]
MAEAMVMNAAASPTIGKAPAPTGIAALEQSLLDVGIPPRPLILERAGEEMRKEEPDFRHLGELISADVSLAAGLLKTANSAYFDSGRAP